MIRNLFIIYLLIGLIKVCSLNFNEIPLLVMITGVLLLISFINSIAQKFPIYSKIMFDAIFVEDDRGTIEKFFDSLFEGATDKSRIEFRRSGINNLIFLASILFSIYTIYLNSENVENLRNFFLACIAWLPYLFR